MTKDIAIADEVPFLGADWFDPLEAGIRQHIRGFIENLLEEELAATLRRGRYDRSTAAAGHRNGHRDRQLRRILGQFVMSGERLRCQSAAIDDPQIGLRPRWAQPVAASDNRLGEFRLDLPLQLLHWLGREPKVNRLTIRSLDLSKRPVQ